MRTNTRAFCDNRPVAETMGTDNLAAKENARSFAYTFPAARKSIARGLPVSRRRKKNLSGRLDATTPGLLYRVCSGLYGPQSADLPR